MTPGVQRVGRLDPRGRFRISSTLISAAALTEAASASIAAIHSTTR